MSDPSIIPTPATPDVCTLALLVDGKDVSGDLQVMSISVSRELNRIPVASIQVEDGWLAVVLTAEDVPRETLSRLHTHLKTANPDVEVEIRSAH